jgi:hypothetical protein
MVDDRTGLRGKGAKLRGSGPAVAELRKWLLSLPGVEVVAVQAFRVEPAAGP